MNNWSEKIIEWLVVIGVGIFGKAYYDKHLHKKKESLEVANLYREGSILTLQADIDIDHMVDEKTSKLKAEVLELRETIVRISTKYAQDEAKHIQRLAELENKFDMQVDRNSEMETRNMNMEKRLNDEVRMRVECMKKLDEINKRMNMLENRDEI